jgi:hypothetical protein
MDGAAAMVSLHLSDSSGSFPHLWTTNSGPYSTSHMHVHVAYNPDGTLQQQQQHHHHHHHHQHTFSCPHPTHHHPQARASVSTLS